MPVVEDIEFVRLRLDIAVRRLRARLADNAGAAGWDLGQALDCIDNARAHLIDARKAARS